MRAKALPRSESGRLLPYSASRLPNFAASKVLPEEILATGLAPAHDEEAALVRALAPGAFTASITGQARQLEVALLEIYDADENQNAHLAKVITRGKVGVADDVMIAGFIVRANGGTANVLIRGAWPVSRSAGLSEPLSDPMLEVHDGNGALIAANNDWAETQQAEIASSALAPPDNREAAIVARLTGWCLHRDPESDGRRYRSRAARDVSTISCRGTATFAVILLTFCPLSPSFGTLPSV